MRGQGEEFSAGLDLLTATVRENSHKKGQKKAYERL